MTLPPELLRDFVQLLSSLQGFFLFVSHKTKLKKDESEYNSPAEVAKRRKRVLDFEAECLKTFDGFVLKGLSLREAISATNKALKEKKMELCLL